MEELMQAAAPFLVPAMAPLFALLWAPLLGARGRSVLVALHLVPALLLVLDVLLFDHAFEAALEVPNVFTRGPEGEPYVWTTELVSAPAWQWHLVAVAYLGLVAAVVFVGRRRPPSAPQPVVAAVSVFVLALGTRLALEKTAAPVGLVWALGSSGATVLIVFFFGYYAGRRGASFGRYFAMFALANLLQRGLLCAASWFLTDGRHGTHLDVHVITDIAMPFQGEVVLADAADAWLHGVLIIQMAYVLPAFTVVGALLGAGPWWFGRRRAAKG